MRQCTTCGRTYEGDESLCEFDGTPLFEIGLAMAEEAINQPVRDNLFAPAKPKRDNNNHQSQLTPEKIDPQEAAGPAIVPKPSPKTVENTHFGQPPHLPNHPPLHHTPENPRANSPVKKMQERPHGTPTHQPPFPKPTPPPTTPTTSNLPHPPEIATKPHSSPNVSLQGQVDPNKRPTESVLPTVPHPTPEPNDEPRRQTPKVAVSSIEVAERRTKMGKAALRPTMRAKRDDDSTFDHDDTNEHQVDRNDDPFFNDALSAPAANEKSTDVGNQDETFNRLTLTVNENEGTKPVKLTSDDTPINPKDNELQTTKGSNTNMVAVGGAVVSILATIGIIIYILVFHN